MKIELPDAYRDLVEVPDWRSAVYYGGRGAARSWSFARYLIGRAYGERIRVGCFREYMTNIAESVHQVLKTQISTLGLNTAFRITENAIVSATGSEFIFKGFKQDPDGIKSLEGLDIAWVEEAHNMSRRSTEILRPTVRKPGSRLMFSMNTNEEDDPIYEDMIVKPQPRSIVKLVTYRDNPWFPEELEFERLLIKERDPDAYNNIWEGSPRKISDAIVFRNKVVVESWDTPGEGSGHEPHQLPRFYFGLDFGFANDPAALTRFYVTGEPPFEELWIDYEAFALRCDIDQLPAVLERVPKVHDWPIKADNARPESISYLSKRGFNITAAEKWNGSVEDGIAHLRAYRKIHLHQRCVNLDREFRFYSYKIDKKTNDVLPVLVDKWNHGIDSLRYGHDGLIQRRGGLSTWAKLGAA